MIDTAASYFNEEQVGNALRHSGLKREDVFVTTKLWVQDYEYDDALRAFDLSMKKLGLDYLDLYLLHKPYGNYYAAWRAAERLYREGRIRAIGVTSFSSERLQDLFLHNEVKPAVNQLETHPFFQQKAANTFLRQEGIQHEAWAPFAEGQNDIWNNPVLKAMAARHGKTVGQVVLRWLNQRNVVVIPKTVRRERMIENLNIFDFAHYVDIKPMVNQLQCNPLVQQQGIGPVLAEHGTRMMAWGPLGGEGADGVVRNGVLASIGEGYGKTAAQVALRWLTQRGIVAIPKSTHVERMRQNLDIFDFTLTEEEMRKISTLNQHDAGTVNFSDPQFVKYLIETYG